MKENGISAAFQIFARRGIPDGVMLFTAEILLECKSYFATYQSITFSVRAYTDWAHA